ncbi:MAG: response regulator transcription factor [Gammaproteobacteria bacterium]|nr:response regulator transcription factor [Gammaproteobacteria bacterium]
MRILLLEKEVLLQREAVAGLKYLGYQVDVVETLEKAKFYSDIRHYDFVLISSLGWVQGDYDRLEFLRNRSSKTALMLLSSVEYELVKLELAEEGCIDWPCTGETLVECIEAFRSRTQLNKVVVGSLVIDPADKSVCYEGVNVGLKGKPFEVLAYLANHGDEEISTAELLNALWLDPDTVSPSIVSVAIKQIRNTIDHRFGVTTVREGKAGYCFCILKQGV